MHRSRNPSRWRLNRSRWPLNRNPRLSNPSRSPNRSRWPLNPSPWPRCRNRSRSRWRLSRSRNPSPNRLPRHPPANRRPPKHRRHRPSPPGWSPPVGAWPPEPDHRHPRLSPGRGDQPPSPDPDPGPPPIHSPSNRPPVLAPALRCRRRASPSPRLRVVRPCRRRASPSRHLRGEVGEVRHRAHAVALAARFVRRAGANGPADRHRAGRPHPWPPVVPVAGAWLDLPAVPAHPAVREGGDGAVPSARNSGAARAGVGGGWPRISSR